MPDNVMSTRSVDNLKALFNVVIGLGLAESVKAVVVLQTNGDIHFNFNNVPTFFALLITIIPFHHGASRHLDETYIARTRPLRHFEGLIDFLFFLSEGIVFYSMALTTNKPDIFFDLLLVLLGVDINWLIFVYFTNDIHFGFLKNWLLINIISFVIIFILNHSQLMIDGIYKWTAITLLLVIRTILDYALCWTYYWPDIEETTEGA